MTEEEKVQIIAQILRDYEEELSDGYKFYVYNGDQIGVVDTKLEYIAKEILSEIKEK